MSSTGEAEKPVVLISGVSGFLGIEAATNLAADFEIVGLDVTPPDDKNIAVDFVETDFTEEQSVASAIQRVRERHGDRIAGVLHLIDYYVFTEEASPTQQELMVESTRHLLQALQPLEVEQFVYSSSLLVMQPAHQQELLTELSPTQAEWEYPKTKLEGEEVCRGEHGKIPLVILRFAGIYNEDCRCLPIADQIRRIYEQRWASFVFPGKPSHGQAFLHVNDAVSCLRSVIAHRADFGPQEVFLVAEPEVLSYSEIQDQLGEMIHDTDWPTVRVPKAVAKAGGRDGEGPKTKREEFLRDWLINVAGNHYAADISRARNKLNWEPRYHLRETLMEMGRRLHEDPRKWYEMNGFQFPENKQML